MSKGDKRRPGTGYADNYDSIFRKPEPQLRPKPAAGDGRQWVAKQVAMADRISSKPTRVTGNFRCKVNGLDTLNDAGFEVVTQPGFNYVLEAIEHPAKTCQHCKHWHGETKRCDNPEVSDMLDADSWRAFEPPADFSCNRWEGKV